MFFVRSFAQRTHADTMPPPLPSKPLGIRLLGTKSPTIVVELFLDLCCPFSRKMSMTMNASADGGPGVLDRIRPSDPNLSSSVEIIFHNLPQPWHPQSPIMHEAMFAVSCAVDHDSALVAAYINAAFAKFPTVFTDLKMMNATRVDIHNLCADIAVEALRSKLGDNADAFRTKMMSYLDFSHLTEDEPHMALGEVTKLLKFAVKHHRIRGVHVTPTVFVNGIEAPDVSSSWTADQWIEKLKDVSGM